MNVKESTEKIVYVAAGHLVQLSRQLYAEMEYEIIEYGSKTITVARGTIQFDIFLVRTRNRYEDQI